MDERKENKAWEALRVHYKSQGKQLNMPTMFGKDPSRFEKFSVQFEDILLDYSKNLINDDTLKLLFQLAEEADVKGWTEKMFTGEKINSTEGNFPDAKFVDSLFEVK